MPSPHPKLLEKRQRQGGKQKPNRRHNRVEPRVRHQYRPHIQPHGQIRENKQQTPPRITRFPFFIGLNTLIAVLQSLYSSANFRKIFHTIISASPRNESRCWFRLYMPLLYYPAQPSQIHSHMAAASLPKKIALSSSPSQFSPSRPRTSHPARILGHQKN